MFYWAIKWRKYGEGDLYVNDKQKEYIEAEWIKDPEDRKSQQFKIKDESYRYDSIDGIQRSTKRIEPDTKALYAGEAPKAKRIPLTTVQDGYDVIVTQWIKRYVSLKEYEHYLKIGYKMLAKEDSGVWVATRVAVYEDGFVPGDTELCDEAESDRMWKTLKNL